LRHFGLSWWESLGPLDKPQTWNGMKIIMRENFVNPALVINSNDEVFQLEDQSIVVSLAMTNLLQDSEQTQEDKDCAKENEELTTSCANSEPSPQNSPSTPTENESKGNESTATLTDGETSLDVLNFSTNQAFIEQLLVEPSLDFPLSQDDLLDVPCDKDDAKQNEELTTSCANSEPSPHNSHSCWPSISTIFTTNIPSDFILLGIYYYNFH